MTIPQKHTVATIGEHIAARVELIDWMRVGTDLDAYGWAMLNGLLSAEECQAIAALYEGGDDFRSHVVMAQHGFGRGEYKYFAYPLPKIIADLRGALYAWLAPIANRWNAAVDLE